jgi:hypothetical protein
MRRLRRKKRTWKTSAKSGTTMRLPMSRRKATRLPWRRREAIRLGLVRLATA